MASISSQHFYSPPNSVSSRELIGTNERLTTKGASANASRTLDSNGSNAQANTSQLSSNYPGSNVVLRSGERVSLSAGQSSSEPPTYEHLSKTLSPQKLNLDDFRRSLNNLSGLTGLTQRYEGTVRTYGALEELNKSEHAQNKLGNWVPAGGAKLGNLLSLTITTKDGDEIDITIDRSMGEDESLGHYSEMSIGFDVTGELDDEERQALAALTNKLGGIAEDYRRNGWTTVGQLGAFDTDELSSFSLSIEGIDKNSFSIEYEIDEPAGERSLSANQNGYQYDLQVDIDGLLLDQDVANNSHYQQYRDLILTTSRSYKGGEETTQRTANFFLEGMNALFQVSASADSSTIRQASLAAETNESNSSSEQENLHPALKARFGGDDGLLQRFSSGLADFTASFSTPILRPNLDRPGEISMMALSLSQTTSITEIINARETKTSVTQKSEFNSNVRQHLGIAGGGVENADLAASEEDGGQTYRYRTEAQRSSLIRTLNFENNEALASVDESRDAKHLRTDKQVVRGEIEEEITKDLTDKNNNTDNHFILPRNSAELRLAEQQIADFRTLEQLEQVVNASQVTLFP